MKIINGFKKAKALLSRKVISTEYTLSPAFKSKLIEMYGTDQPEQVVRQIVEAVRVQGDKAIREYSKKLTG
jgi:histidinol dehydrogenase